MFDFGQVKESSPVLKFIGYGKNESVVVVNTEHGLTNNNVPFIDIFVKFKTAEDKDKTKIKLYMSAAAAPRSMQKIMHLHQAVNKMANIQARSFSNLGEMSDALNSMWAGREFRLKLVGKEYVGVDKEGSPKVKVKVELPLPPFAEAMSGMGEKPMVTADASKLKFDKANKWDYAVLSAEDARKLAHPGGSVAPQPAGPSFDSPNGLTDDMPF